MKKFKITINGKKVQCEQGQTVLQVARKNGINIPALCYHPDLKIKENCRLCLVEVKGQKGLQTACSVKCEPGMIVKTNSSAVKFARKINFELIWSQHSVKCGDCTNAFDCSFKKIGADVGVDFNKFEKRDKKSKIIRFGPSIEFDVSKCIDCRNCIDACEKQGINFFELAEKDSFQQVTPSCSKDIDCIYCGQCIVHCPVGALQTVSEEKEVEKALKDKNKIVVFQFAPSIRASIGEEFGMKHGSVVTDKLSNAIRKLGADYVFDVSVGADFTTVEEAKELIERIKEKKHLPMFTSCCPAWVKYVEFYKPELIPNLTTVRSPHIILGGIVKNYWAEKEKINPKKIVVVSIMPCTSKKYEVRRKELKVKGLAPVDLVLTTKELALMMKKHRIDLSKVKAKSADNPLGDPSGAGVIYGASGGVMESALRTAYEEITGCKLCKLDFKNVRGIKGLKTADVKVGKLKVKVAVANGITNAQQILEELKKDPKKYHYVEVMACEGGCIGGGGQPTPVDNDIRNKRVAALYSIDTKKKVRRAHENPNVKKTYKEYFVSEKKIKPICHTKFFKKKKEFKP